MHKLRYVFVGLLASFPAARSVPWAGPTQTVHSGCADGVQIPTPTDGPKIELVVEELKRDIAIPPNTCGWVNGISDQPWIVLVASTCLWYSERTVVNGFTACIDYGSTCSGDCSLMNTWYATPPSLP
ncbi:hypothetical protein N431DRAFT_492365 [Stipitochalara longipes BDJ]|nr:hypothetical protein N431DRAFT_492365 [Stipitochalara longipes BDJ]